MVNHKPDPLSQTFAALADPTRRALLARLTQGEASVTELAAPFRREMSLPAITKHLKVLEHAKLISKTRQAQWRRCKLEAEPLRNATDWMEQYRQFFEESFDRLEAYLKTVTEKEPGAKETSAKASPTKESVKGKSHVRKKPIK
jgi:DNA-binding transcriptional ArsR family regulator